MLLLGLAFPTLIRKAIGLAVAPGFTERIYQKVLAPEDKETLERTGKVYFERGGFTYCLTMKLIKDGRQNLLENPEYPFPVHLIHGREDTVAPWEYAQQTLDGLSAPHRALSLIPDAEHMLNREGDLAFITSVI
jgi:pimeloyl-ACP methyl ester carboxylesterase